jgi:hypothetical protein
VAQLLVALLPGGIDPVQVVLTVWPIVEGTVRLLVAGVAASTVRTKEECVKVVMIAAIVTQASADKTIFIRKLSSVLRGFSDFCDIRSLLQQQQTFFGVTMPHKNN